MNIEVLDQNLDLIAVISEYESFIWTDRYNKPGDFELYSPINDENLKYLVRDNYLRLDTSKHLMIIEDIIYQSSTNGKHVQITGRSLESILDRRIVWGRINLEGNFQQQIQKLFDQNIFKSAESRKIENLVYEHSTDEAITKLTVSNQYTGDTLLKIVEELTEEFDIGWQIILNDDKQFVFSFYTGTDRSYAQSENNYVVFSPAYENVIESTYTISGSTLKTMLLIVTEGNSYSSDGEESIDMSERTVIYRALGGGTGLLRREMYTNGSGIRQEEGESLDSYIRKLDQYGKEELKRNSLVKKFEGQYETKTVFKYGVDFFMGDIVEVADEYGNEASSKIIEFIWSNNVSNGEEAYPTFRSDETNEE